MTHQETFNIVKEHLLKQGEQATINGQCRLRGANGTKCAIGALIPDEKYHSKMEWMLTGLEQFELLPLEKPFYIELQQLHDFEPVSKWPEKLKLFAVKRNLRYE